MKPSAFWRSLLGGFLVLGFLTVSTQAQERSEVYTLQADGLACPFCAYGIEKQLNGIEGIEAVETDIRSGTVTLRMRAGANLDEDTASKAVEAAGFTMRGFKRQGTDE